jgi:2-amino-4-hydroxy-6-hydroxymethyldihydropteridine diphosphokinase
MPSAASFSYSVVVGLGANLGDRLVNLRRACDRLADAAQLLARSRVYETPPAGGPAQPDYLNAAVLLRTDEPIDALLARCLEVERSMGRKRPDPVRFGPRPIDLDLLWAGELIVADGSLELPHPRLTQRSFALRPLLDVAPDACDPRDGAPYADQPAARELLTAVAHL